MKCRNLQPKINALKISVRNLHLLKTYGYLLKGLESLVFRWELNLIVLTMDVSSAD